jgi:hypothetical protein
MRLILAWPSGELILMAEITDEHLEWATVDRMRQLLADVDNDFKVTHTYALFSSILCWVIQRARAAELAPADRAARGLFEQLQGERATDARWRLRPHRQLIEFEFMPISRLQAIDDLPASTLLIAMRNAVAHGDSRTVSPINANGRLVGIEFKLNEYERPRGRLRRLLWRGRVRLHRAEMREIGDMLGQRFCDCMRAANVDHPQFVENARLVREVEAA